MPIIGVEKKTSNPYITNDCVIGRILRLRVVDDDLEIEGDSLVCDGRELVTETETIDATDVSVPCQLSSCLTRHLVNSLVQR